jgi:hypothetical protein
VRAASRLNLGLVVPRVPVSIRTAGQNCRITKAPQQEMQKASIEHAKSIFAAIQMLDCASKCGAIQFDLLFKFADVRNLRKEAVIQEPVSIRIKSSRLE